MPTSTSSSSSSSTASSAAPTAPTAADVAALLAASGSTTVYVDLPALTDTVAAAMLTGDPALHIEKDVVRDKWAVRKATVEEVAEAIAAASSTP